VPTPLPKRSTSAIPSVAAWSPVRLFPYVTVAVTGASVMILELLGTRIIGPFYGVSLVVWSSLISVALIALSIGYLAGGRLSARGSRLRLPHLLLLCAAWTGLIPLLSQPVQTAMDGLGLRAGAFLSALLLFAPPLALLGMVGPYVIQGSARRLEEVGATAGNVYAVSTLGSVIGTLALGFFLLPEAGTQAILLSTGVVLAALSAAVAVDERRRAPPRGWPARWIALCLGVIAALVALFLLRGARTYPGYTVVSQAETHYGWVRVVDQEEKGIRWLLSDASTIGAEDRASGASLLAYQRVAGLVPWFRRGSKDALLVGLGGGHLVGAWAQLGIATDAVEIDPAVAEAARRHFTFRPTGQVVLGDGRYQVKRLARRYDVIVQDCFTGGAEPIHLLSVEALAELKARLVPGGVLAVNFVGFTQERDERPVESVARTLDQVFRHRRTFVSAPGALFNDYVFVVSDRELELDEDAHGKPVADFLRRHEVRVTGEGGRIVTDDLNPLEYQQIAKAEHYRDVLIERVGRDVLFR
jgi:spermidine synthase